MKPGQDNHGIERHGLDRHGVDGIDGHNRLQLSALMDGELPLDEARFLLRRLQHDSDLGGCWERWQFCGDLLRGRADIPLPAGFAERVAAVVAAEPGAAASLAGRPRWVRWGSGAALAASVAVVALFVARQAPDANVPVVPAASVQVAATTPSVAPPVVPAPTAPDRAAQLAAAVAVADVPRRMAARRSRAQIQREPRVQARVDAPEAIVANTPASMPSSIGPPANPFAARRMVPVRPWPRALLPGVPASGAFTVDYGNGGSASPSFYPFGPDLTPAQPAEAPAPDGNPAP